MRRALALAVLAAGCSGLDVDLALDTVACRWHECRDVEFEEPAPSDLPCRRVTAPPGLALSPISDRACTVEGATCLIIARGERFRCWARLRCERVPELQIEPVSCDATCPEW